MPGYRQPKRDIVKVGNPTMAATHASGTTAGSDSGLMSPKRWQSYRTPIRGRDGYLRVDYGRIGVRLQTWEAWNATTH